MVRKNYRTWGRTMRFSGTRVTRSSGARASMAKWIIIAVICLAGVAVVTAGVVLFTYDEEAVVKGDLDKMANWYYEEYIYNGLVEEGTSPERLNELMDRYIVRGFSITKLRKLLSHEEAIKDVDAALIKKHCDVNKTTVKFYPEEPFDKKSYRMDWRYDCDFK